MKGSLLPLGTVVMLEGGTKKAMITGYYTRESDDTKVYTYNACIFPEGFMDNVFILFDAPSISEVLYMGLENEESQVYNHKLDAKLKDMAVKGVAKNSEFKTVPGGFKVMVTAPKNPMSLSEAKAKYTSKQASGRLAGETDIKIIGRDI